MKKILAIVLTAAIAALALTGCKAPSADSGKPEQKSGITVNKIKFEKVQYEKLPDDKKMLVESKKGTRGYLVWEEDGSFVIFITSGEKSTGGYSINVKYIEDNEGITKISVEEKSPAPGDAVTEAITYPYIIVKAKGITDNFNIENTKGEKFSPLQNNKSPLVENVRGSFVGAIDNSFVEIIVDNQPQAFMITEVEDKIKNIRDGDEVILSYEKNEYGQLILKSIEKAE